MSRILILITFLSICTSVYAQNSNACIRNDTIHLVILGSSTAAGTGPTSSDSTWVNRYRSYLQSLNPVNMVTNLAIGGTTTYDIMPDWYIPPTGRPIGNTTNNISQAIRLGADAIIVNMPSNDAARGFTKVEQLANFDTLNKVADSAQIPIWFCTTQPRNFSLAQKKIQLDVRDTILTKYSPFTIDFWNGFADTNHIIKSIYDSGDGVHMNDLAHGILNQRVQQKYIPTHLVDTLAFTDIRMEANMLFNESSCGAMNEPIQLIVSNLGIINQSTLNITLETIDQQSASIITYLDSITQNLAACSSDTITFFINSSNGADYFIRGFVDSVDSNSVNDTNEYVVFERFELPQINPINDTACFTDSILLITQALSFTDSIGWFDSLQSTTPFHYGWTLQLAPNASKRTYYVEGLRGPFHYVEEFESSLSTNVNWNGYMFNIIAKDSIYLDSISIPINSTGSQQIISYYRNGTYQGHENNALSWTSWGTDTVSVSQSGDLQVIANSPLFLVPGDTLGIYLHLQNAGATLSYQRVNTPTIRGNNKLDISSGSGISNTFGAIFFPRDFSGIVHYHYGFNPIGQCQSNRQLIQGAVSMLELDLGADTTIMSKDSLSFSISSDFSNLNWSTGDSSRQLQFDAQNLQPGPNLIWLTAWNRHNCFTSDTLLINLQLSTSLLEQKNASYQIYPNPTNGILTIQGVPPKSEIYLLNYQGAFIRKLDPVKINYDLEGLPKGSYLIQISNAIGNFYEHIIRY